MHRKPRKRSLKGLEVSAHLIPASIQLIVALRHRRVILRRMQTVRKKHIPLHPHSRRGSQIAPRLKLKCDKLVCTLSLHSECRVLKRKRDTGPLLKVLVSGCPRGFGAHMLSAASGEGAPPSAPMEA